MVGLCIDRFACAAQHVRAQRHALSVLRVILHVKVQQACSAKHEMKHLSWAKVNSRVRLI